MDSDLKINISEYDPLYIIRDYSQFGLWKSFNNTHPECGPHERFYSNIIKGDKPEDNRFKTFRPGKQAYDINGDPIEKYVPWFVSRIEWEEVGKNSTL